MLVSVIIPIYNVAPYIEEGLQSVMRQTFRDIEVLLIDDCGTDQSMAIVRSMLGNAEDTIIDGIRYRILHHEYNRGLSAARNTGINAAVGNWLYFLDSDDWIEPVCIEILVQAVMKEDDIEMAVGQLEPFDEHGNRVARQLNGVKIPLLNMQEGISAHGIMQKFLEGDVYEMAWNKLISREFITAHNLYFEEGLIHEDNLWSFCCACHLTKIAAVSQTLYHYRVRQASIMSQSVGDVRVKAFNTILCAKIDYAILHGWGNDKLVFDNLFPKIKGGFFSSAFRQDKRHAVDLFTKLKKANFWTCRQLWLLVPAKRDFFPYLSRFLPEAVGLSCYMRIGALVWKM